MGFTVLAEVAERARSSSTVGGGSFRAERVTPHGVNESLVDELYVVVKVAKLGQRPEESSATLRADAARWREVGAPQQQTLTPCARPTATAATRPAERRRVGTRRERLPADRVAEEGAELVRRCAGG